MEMEGVDLKIKTEESSGNSEDQNVWSAEDFEKLLDNMASLLPVNDRFSYSRRVQKLPWKEIVVGNHTGEECKEAWLHLQKKLRHFRTLPEVICDARQLILEDSNNNGTRLGVKPPNKPPSCFLFFFKHHKDDLMKTHPGIIMSEVFKRVSSLYKNATMEEKEPFMKMALEAQEEYKKKLNVFQENHPEFKTTTVAPKRPKGPFEFYFEDQLKSDNLENGSSKEAIRQKWKSLSDDKKIFWIYLAENECKTFLEQNPELASLKKPLLTKEEQKIKQKMAGKPNKPPVSAYHLFVRDRMSSNELKHLSARKRMSHIYMIWKNIPEDEREEYKDNHHQMMLQYKKEYKSYLDTLTEDEKCEELTRGNSRKRKQKQDISFVEAEITENVQEEDSSETKKIKTVRIISEEDLLLINRKLELQKPKTPPITALGYFKQKYSGKKSCEIAWAKLRKSEKKRYENELKAVKKNYIAEFERFLRSLTREEVEIFSLQNS